jgi:hypothetical protein
LITPLGPSQTEKRAQSIDETTSKVKRSSRHSIKKHRLHGLA